MIAWCTEHARHVRGVQRVMYHWRISANSTAANPDSKPYSLRSCRLTIQGQLERRDIDADIIGSGIFNLHDLWFRNVSGSVSVVVDCGDDPKTTRQFVETFCQSDSYADMKANGVRNEKIVPVSEMDPEVLAEAGVTEDVLANPSLENNVPIPMRLWRGVPYDKHYLPDFALSSRPRWVVKNGTATLAGSSMPLVCGTITRMPGSPTSVASRPASSSLRAR